MVANSIMIFDDHRVDRRSSFSTAENYPRRNSFAYMNHDLLGALISM